MTERYSAKLFVNAPPCVAELIREVLSPDPFLPQPSVEQGLLTFVLSSDSPRKLRAELNSLLRSLALIEDLLWVTGLRLP